MPTIENITPKTELKIDLSVFFKEEAFITIKRLNKYMFTYLSNKNRDGYNAQVFSKTLDLVASRPDYNPETPINEIFISPAEHRQVRASFDLNEAKEAMKIENEVELAYFRESILSDKHNFFNEAGELIELDGEWFYQTYGDLEDEKHMSLSDYVKKEILSLNYSGLSLGEQIVKN